MNRDAALDELIDDLFRQAEETAHSGDVQAARQIYEAVLQIDPQNTRALGVLGLSTSAMPPPPTREEKNPAATTPANEATTGPSAPPGPPAAPPAPAVMRTQPVAIVRPTQPPPPGPEGVFRLGPQPDETDAATPAAPPPSAQAVREDAASPSPEAEPLVGRVRDELAQGHLLEARRLANRAASLPGGAEMNKALLGEIRNYVETAAREAETLLAQGIAEFERGRMGVAMELFQQALARDPSHPVVQDYLARAEAARTGPDMEGPDFGLEQEAGMSHGGGPTRTAPHEEATSATAVATQAAPPTPATAPTAPDPTPPVAPDADLALETPEAQAADASAAPTPAPRPARSTRLAVRPKRSLAPGKLIRPALIVVVAAAAVWFGGRQLGFWGPKRAASGVAGAATHGTVDKPSHLPAVRRAAPPPTPAAAAPTPAAPTAAPEDKVEVRDLLAQAQTAVAQGREADAVSLLSAARERQPESLDILDRLEKARAALQNRTLAGRHIDEGKARWAEENFSDALRIFYRVPQTYQPAGLNRWIANGWYNLGVQQLQSGSLREAIEQFGSCLELQPDDDAARRGQQVARRYLNKTQDDAYWVFVRSLRFRGLEDRP